LCSVCHSVHAATSHLVVVVLTYVPCMPLRLFYYQTASRSLHSLAPHPLPRPCPMHVLWQRFHARVTPTFLDTGLALPVVQAEGPRFARSAPLPLWKWRDCSGTTLTDPSHAPCPDSTHSPLPGCEVPTTPVNLPSLLPDPVFFFVLYSYP